jgi:hypothetical protein
MGIEECLLARRTLLYGRFKLSFRCPTEDASEILPEGERHMQEYYKKKGPGSLQNYKEIQSTLRRRERQPQSRLWIIVQPDIPLHIRTGRPSGFSTPKQRKTFVLFSIA